jgi:DHA3 family macrolide efflux protein-like MFS transporter
MNSLAVAPARSFKRFVPGARIGGTLVRRNAALRRMLLAALVSTCGDRLHQVALAALVLGMTDSMASAGLIFVVSTIPYALFGLPVGALVDRWNRRTAMISTDLVRGVLVLGIPFAVVVNLPLVYALLFCLTCASMIFNPARQAAIPDLVEPDDLSSANTLFQAVNYLVDVIAFPLAGIIVALLIEQLGFQQGTFVVFGVDAISYVLSAALLIGLPIGRAEPDMSTGKLRGLASQVAEGLRYLCGNAVLRTNTILLTLGPLLLGSLHTLWIGFAWRVSHSDAWGYGLTESATAIGTLCGLWVLQSLSRRFNKGRVIAIGFVTMGAAVVAVGFTDSLSVAIVLAAVAGAGNMLFLVPSITMVQQQTPPELCGRVVGVRHSLTFTAFMISNAAAGLLAEAIGVSPLLAVLGGGMVAVGGVAMVARSTREAT